MAEAVVPFSSGVSDIFCPECILAVHCSEAQSERYLCFTGQVTRGHSEGDAGVSCKERAQGKQQLAEEDCRSAGKRGQETVGVVLPPGHSVSCGHSLCPTVQSCAAAEVLSMQET